MKEFYRGKKVLITGHTGFQGAWLSYLLQRWGAQVAGLSLPPATAPNLFSIFKLPSTISNHFFDIRNLANITPVIEKEQPEIVFHLAAQAIVRDSYDNPLDTFATNIIGTAQVLEAIRTAGQPVKSAVVVTTDKVYENQEAEILYSEEDKLGGYDPYSSSKAAADIVAQSYNQSFFNPSEYPKRHQTLVAIARSGNVIGGGDWASHRLLPDIVRALYEDKKEVVIRNPAAVRPWQHVFEPLQGYLLLAKALYEGDVAAVGAWNFGPEADHRYTVAEVVAEALKDFGRGSFRVEADTENKYEAGLLMLDTAKAKQKLGWNPRFSMAEAIKRTAQWYRTYYEEKEKILALSDEQMDQYFG